MAGPLWAPFYLGIKELVTLLDLDKQLAGHWGNAHGSLFSITQPSSKTVQRLMSLLINPPTTKALILLSTITPSRLLIKGYLG